MPTSPEKNEIYNLRNIYDKKTKKKYNGKVLTIHSGDFVRVISPFKK
jgi:hypothetical protein